MKNRAGIFIAACLMFSLAACSPGEGSGQPSNTQASAKAQEQTLPEKDEAEEETFEIEVQKEGPVQTADAKPAGKAGTEPSETADAEPAQRPDVSGIYNDKQGTRTVYNDLMLALNEDGTYTAEIGIHRTGVLRGTAAWEGDRLRFASDAPHNVLADISIIDGKAEMTVISDPDEFLDVDVYSFPDGSSEDQGSGSYRSVLLGESSFMCTDLANERLNISEVGQAITSDGSADVNAVKFAMIDLDGDGGDEIVLWLQNGMNDCGFEILHEQNGETYGYTMWYRAFMELKADGTFIFSGGAADSGIGRMAFSEAGYSINPQAYSQSGYDSDNELTVQYFMNDESCSEDEFYDALNVQDRKEDAEWHDLSDSNINALLQ